MKISEFQKSVYSVCRKIPRGKVSTYGEIARAIGKPKAARSVGNALNKNPFAPEVPCHRIVKNDGGVGGFAGGQNKKINILRREGIKIEGNRLIDFQKIIFKFK